MGQKEARVYTLQNAIYNNSTLDRPIPHLVCVLTTVPLLQVIEQRERVLARLWHVAEYRGVGIVSRLALALERSHYPHVSAKLTSECTQKLY